MKKYRVALRLSASPVKSGPSTGFIDEAAPESKLSLEGTIEVEAESAADALSQIATEAPRRLAQSLGEKGGEA